MRNYYQLFILVRNIERLKTGKFVIIIFFFTAILWGQEYQWTLVNDNSSRINSINFSKTGVGWATGYNGFIWKSTDNGDNWEYLRLDNNPNLISVCVVDADTIWCLSEKGAVYKSEDEGINWQKMKDGNEDDLFYSDILVTSNNHVFVFGVELNNINEEVPSSFFYKSIDGGNNWTKTNIEKEKFFLRKAKLTIEDNLYVCGSYGNFTTNKDQNGLILSSDNEGTSWTKIFNDTSLHEINTISVVNKSTIWAIGDYYTNLYGNPVIKIFKTENAGISWSEKTVPLSTCGYNGIFFVSVYVGWLFGKGKLLETRDSGISWCDYNLSYTTELKEPFFISDSMGWVTDGSWIYKYEKNKPPKSFRLSKPADKISIEEYSLRFEWNRSTYSINDPTFYSLKIYSESQDTIISDIPANAYNFNGSTLFVDSTQYSWTVIASDGEFNTPATDTLSFNFYVPSDSSDTTNTMLDSKFYNSSDNYILYQNYPNPLNPETVIGYRLAVIGNVELTVYNVLGQKVATLFKGKQNPGSYSYRWNAGTLPSGVYLYRLATDKGLALTKKMILLK